MLASAQRIIQFIEEFAPKHLAMEGDRIGLQIGTLQKKVKKVMVALDILEEVVDEAIAEGVDLLVAHHAVIFQPLKQIRTDLPAGRIIEKLIKHDIAVYIAHTNLDTAPGGINDWLVEALGLQEVELLQEGYQQKLKKLVVFVPETHVEEVRVAISTAGAGWIGNYSHCTFSTNGTGTFLPQDGTQPFIGEVGRLEKVEEVRLETIVPEGIQGKVIKAMLKSHPYEEVAYDLYPLEQKGETFGIGRVGKLPTPLSLQDFALQIKETFALTGIRVVGPLDRPVQKIAVLGGDGNRYVQSAIFRGADVLVTGDVYYHTAQDAMMAGLSIIDPGHNVEKVMKEGIKKVLENRMKAEGLTTCVLASKIHTDPFTFL